ncbi:MAG: TetR/AcrR family transcriptional regulator [Actinomycetaceae bacterium]|nr:TetR/AcrR family transcriptional regulator [Actinomycetaceae bacterium]
MAETVSETKVMDATRECIIDKGIRGATVTEIARRAGVSRMTIYRRWESAENLILDTHERELRMRLKQAVDLANKGTFRQRLVTLLTNFVSIAGQNRLIPRVLATNSELPEPYATQYLERSHALFTGILRKYLSAGAADGSIGTRDPSLTTALLMHVSKHLISSGILDEPGTNLEALLKEIAFLFDSYLAPRRMR